MPTKLTNEEWLAIGFVVLASFLMMAGGAGFLSSDEGVFPYLASRFSGFFSFGGGASSFIRQFFAVGSVIFIMIISYSVIKLFQIFNKTKFVFPGEDFEEGEEGEGKTYSTPQGEHWARVQKLFLSENPSDWKIAILEADIMLDDMVRRMGYAGDTLGECLKQIERSDFTTLDLAWEAHNFRNKIAHEPDSSISRRDINRIIGFFEKVFREFSYL
jgi:hypothetical protein